MKSFEKKVEREKESIKIMEKRKDLVLREIDEFRLQSNGEVKIDVHDFGESEHADLFINTGLEYGIWSWYGPAAYAQEMIL